MQELPTLWFYHTGWGNVEQDCENCILWTLPELVREICSACAFQTALIVPRARSFWALGLCRLTQGLRRLPAKPFSNNNNSQEVSGLQLS